MAINLEKNNMIVAAAIPKQAVPSDGDFDKIDPA